MTVDFITFVIVVVVQYGASTVDLDVGNGFGDTRRHSAISGSCSAIFGRHGNESDHVIVGGRAIVTATIQNRT